jgi:hypothetical protein
LNSSNGDGDVDDDDIVSKFNYNPNSLFFSESRHSEDDGDAEHVPLPKSLADGFAGGRWTFRCSALLPDVLELCKVDSVGVVVGHVPMLLVMHAVHLDTVLSMLMFWSLASGMCGGIGKVIGDDDVVIGPLLRGLALVLGGDDGQDELGLIVRGPGMLGALGGGLICNSGLFNLF